ncbi:MAG TPA: beta-ketoacyl-ACP synthase III [Actinophytocola sp.]|jgi:3-oxoacyl-[acyl-carrier-protein] synthase-3|uniref:3-oxoacyl-ACP synthase III family protein n=1 Tax=Actinophytocola sp. TaxID=1872138 RepID=UPI002F9389FB
MNTTILGTGSYLPKEVLTSEELDVRLGVDAGWIFDKTLIRERRVAAPHEASSDLATEAAQRALDAACVDAADVDLIVLATSTPDQPLPATACLVQRNLGATGAAAFDVGAVCTGFVYALSVADAMLAANPQYEAALVIGVDTYSRILDYTDRRTACLFGDGAGAVVLGRSAGTAGILGGVLGADGSLADLVQIPGGGSRKPASADTVEHGDHFFKMRGREVRTVTGAAISGLIDDVLKSAGVTMDDVDLVVPHQANGVMMREWSDKLGIGSDVMHMTVGTTGNTGAASVPICLDDAARADRLAAGDIVLLVAFGGGFTWGGHVLRWNGCV